MTPSIEFPKLTCGNFQSRLNRFLAAVTVEGQEHLAHIANSGRLERLLIPGAQVWLSHVKSLKRKSQFDLSLVENRGVLVSVDSRIPNKIYGRLLNEWVSNAERDRTVYSEVKLGRSRIDFKVVDHSEITWIETKSVTFLENSIAKFPDAPTSRGIRHTDELAEAVRLGEKAKLVFIVQRSDALSFSPNKSIDPDFNESLIAASKAGVMLEAYNCIVSLREIRIKSSIPVIL